MIIEINPVKHKAMKAKPEWQASYYDTMVNSQVATRLQFDDYRSFGMLAFRNGLEYQNLDFSRLIGSHICTSCENLVRFRLVTPEFKRKKLYGRSR